MDYPVWSPDGKWVAYRTVLNGSSALKIRAVDDSGPARQIGADSRQVMWPVDWSHDGRHLILVSSPYFERNTRDSLQAWPVSGSAQPVLKIEDANTGSLSYDGHWLAYFAGDDDQLYVTSFPTPGPRIAIAAGGADPHWRADGQELFYVDRDRNLIAVQIRETAQQFTVTSSSRLFQLQLPLGVGAYDVTPDGQRFLVATRTHLEQSSPLTVVTDWPARLLESDTQR
jgi:Tol biopolymer transport system component